MFGTRPSFELIQWAAKRSLENPLAKAIIPDLGKEGDHVLADLIRSQNAITIANLMSNSSGLTSMVEPVEGDGGIESNSDRK